MTTFRKIVLANRQFYHVYNRGVERRSVFTNKIEFQRAVEIIKYYRFTNLPLKFSKFLVQPSEKQSEILADLDNPENRQVEIIAYCFMPNHFHFLLCQLQDNGISKFVANFTNSYTKYFNTKHERNGPLAQGIFKAVLIETDEQLIHLSRYIHLNPVVSFITKDQDLENYQWSSLREYLKLGNGFCDKEYVLHNFSSCKRYRQFVYDHISYAKELEKIKHLTLE
ncbi:transposase [Candidatus Gottesmanbacteria bacterium]|nr:transposase [Candidatus Gottesmanbacteria bacterium]